MKTYKQLISEVAQPKAEDEIDFKAKHEVEFIDHPESEENQHTANDMKKAKRIADYEEGEDMEVYEDASDEVRMMTRQLEFIKYAADEIAEFLNDWNVDPEEWFQNKLTRVHTYIQGLHSYMEGEKRMMDRSSDEDEMDYDMDYDMEDSFVWEEKMTDAQMKRREEIVKGMKKNQADLKKRYGNAWKGVMYATATKMAMEEALQEAAMTDDHWVIVKRNGNFYSGKSEIKKIVRASTNPPSQKVIEKHGGDSAVRVGELRKSLRGKKDTGELLGQLGEVRIYEKKLDKVNKDALKKDFDDRADKDIDNDGEVDDQDEYLHNRRKAITKAMANESFELGEAKWEFKPATYMVGGNLRYDDKMEYTLSKSDADILTKYLQKAKDDKERSKVWSMFWDSNETGNKPTGPLKAIAYAKKGLKEEVELDEAAQPTWQVMVRKPFGAGGVNVKKGDSVEVKARNTAEAINKAMEKMGIAKKDSAGVSGSNFDLKKLKESVDLEEAVKVGNLKLKDGSRVKLSKDDAETLNSILDSVSSSSKKKMEETMMKDQKGFEEILNFAKEAM